MGASSAKQLGQYSIKDLEKLSGVKAHTIRIWEQRYALITPHRTDTNIRYYDDAHLKKMLKVSRLIDHGMKISKISDLSDGQLNDKLKDISLDTTIAPHQDLMGDLILSMIDLDEAKFNEIFSSCVMRLGFESAITDIIYPFLNKVGLMWGVNEVNPAQEHFVSNLIRQKIISAIDQLPTPTDSKKTFLLFLIEDELHELALLLSQYLIKSGGHKVIYLGQNVPVADLLTVMEIRKPDYLLTFLTANKPVEHFTSYVKHISESPYSGQILVSGSEYMKTPGQKIMGIQWLEDISGLKNLI